MGLIRGYHKKVKFKLNQTYQFIRYKSLSQGLPVKINSVGDNWFKNHLQDLT